MSTPTKEQILQAFSLYIGQFASYADNIVEVQGLMMAACSLIIIKNPERVGRVIYERVKGDNLLDCQLLLRDISSLTDEECKEIAKLALGGKDTSRFLVNRPGRIEVSRGIECVLIFLRGNVRNSKGAVAEQSQIQQYLFKLGMNLPIYELGGLTPVEAGIATIKKEEVK